ncbi:MAG: proline--tRNA ligase [Verrucomicrobiae bacterium]|nr:proline--tRNA ligase [Verrucomicrobiae bacterium]
MRWSQSFIPTLKENPKEAEIPSHQLLIRAGLVRQLTGGVYTFLPLGFRVLKKIEQIVREEMDRAGALEVLMPTIHPKEMWERTGRYTTINEILFKVKDRTGREFVLGPTHEEIVTALVANDVKSYRQLPKNIYQIQNKFRDEPRPRFGLIRVKEFTMKDAYSFDVDDAAADKSYQAMYDAYRRIFERLGLNTKIVEAHSGAMGGSHSHEFMVCSPAGEDRIASCDKCSYAANMEKATSRVERRVSSVESQQTDKFATPGVRTIEQLTKLHGVPPEQQIKTLVYTTGTLSILVLLRGNHQLNEAKFQTATDGVVFRPSSPEEIKALLAASPGSLGAVGVPNTKAAIYAEETLRGAKDMVTGANDNGFHLRGVNIERDIQVAKWADLRSVQAGEGCPKCDGTLSVDSAIEIGHVFKLGTKYSAAIGANYLDEKGVSKVMIMGCYGIGVSRIVAALIEQHHDKDGIQWPLSVAPYKVCISPVNLAHAETKELAEKLYADLQTAGIEVILDDRDERPGIKFKDADLVGFPIRVTIGEKGLANGQVEVRIRATNQTKLVEKTKIREEVLALVKP